MRLRSAICLLLVLLTAPAVARDAPRNLLEDAQLWQAHGGAWKWDTAAGTASVAAGETVAEFSATRGLPLAGRWLTLKASLSGDAPKCGLWFSGLRDGQEQTFRLVLDSTAGAITNGRGKTLSALPPGAFNGPLEIILTFSAGKVLIEHAGAKLGEFPVKFEEQEPTPSLFAERGAVEFREMILSGAPPIAEDEPMKQPADRRAGAQPKDAAPPAPANAPGLVVDFTGVNMHVLKSRWIEYFGVHDDTAPGPWKTIRQYDGPEFGMPHADRHSGDVKTFDGPFAKMPVQTSLGDFGDWTRKDAKRLDSHVKTLIEEGRSAVFIAPWLRPFDFEQQDQVWALMKVLYGGHVGAEEHVFFQWGDDINSRHLGSALNKTARSAKPRGGSSGGRGANKDEDITAYVEHYLAPAIEAVRLASEEIYKDPERIPVLTGSCSRASEPENRRWFARMLDRTIEGSIALTLKGRRVVELVDYITVDYPFYKAGDASALQELWDRFGREVKGLWVTAEYGSAGRGVADLLQTAALYLDWAARNELDAKQTRLIWSLPDEKRDKFGVRAAVRQLGGSFDGPLRAGAFDAGESKMLRIASGGSRMLIVNIPPAEKRGKKPDDIARITLAVTAEQAAKPWMARIISEKDRRQPPEGTVLPVAKDGTNLVLKIDASPRDAWALIVETP